MTGSPKGSLKDQTALIVGRGSGHQGVLFALTNTFLTGQTLHLDGGEPLG
jgi:hypothetical protein